jgi:two-component system, NarL family, sensor kinase
MQKIPYDIIIFFATVSGIILALATFIVYMLVRYRKRQNRFSQTLEELKLNHEKNLINTRYEIQEQTCQHISKEIHDDINLSLTLAKLYLNTIDLADITDSLFKINEAVISLSNSINKLSQISKSLNTDIIMHQGLLKALDEEIGRIRNTGLFTVHYSTDGTPVFMDSQKEVFIFRIIQECFNNAIKHAGARNVTLSLNYGNENLQISFLDDGEGFNTENKQLQSSHAGLNNMSTRIKLLAGKMNIQSFKEKGTALNFIIPLNNHETTPSAK